ncbi:uncharacterized protein LOC135815319 [Sycon ciliatum]|uniref:uncharacterized protein LOC135815319 n=1 Tax=Sycon ciliatum TaxID=27933 RepID=UPI0020ABDA10
MPQSVSFKLSDFVAKNELPCTVTVTRGYSHGSADEEESISNGEVITLHTVRDLQVIRATDHLDRDVTLPAVHGDSKFELLPENPRLDKVIYDTFLDMIVDPNMPQKVRVTAAVDSGDDDTIYEDDILEMLTVAGNSQSGSGDKRCIVLKNQFGEKLTLPLSTPGKFSTHIDTKRYSMLEVLDKFKLPVRVLQVNTVPGQSKSSGHNKFRLDKRQVETSVLATVNKELIYLPLECDIEVCLLASPTVTNVPPPEISITTDDEPAPEPIATADDSAGGEGQLAGSALTMSISAPEGWNSASSSARSSDVFDDSTTLSTMALLSERDKERIRVGSIRRFGSQSNLREEASSPEMDEDVSRQPQRALELIEQLQEKTAEAIRLQEWCNKWQAKCQRLEAQTQHIRKSMDESERRALFWRHQVQAKMPVTESILRDMDQYQKTGDRKHMGRLPSWSDDKFTYTSALSALTNANTTAPTPTQTAPVQQPQQKQEDMDATGLSIQQIQALLKALNMAEYCQVFLDEQIDGGLLLDLPEDSLKTDLAITSLLHRKKLLRALKGLGPASLRELVSS